MPWVEKEYVEGYFFSSSPCHPICGQTSAKNTVCHNEVLEQGQRIASDALSKALLRERVHVLREYVKDVAMRYCRRKIECKHLPTKAQIKSPTNDIPGKITS
ncbi:uncharacterized protein LOC144456199 [Phascolarctos cinereus]